MLLQALFIKEIPGRTSLGLWDFLPWASNSIPGANNNGKMFPQISL